jgi:sortase (surface protein transpeptidase)
VVAGVVLLVLAATLAAARSGPPEPPAGRSLPATALAAERPAAPTPARRSAREPVAVIDRQAPRPRRIAIPAIGVSAPLVALGLAPDRSMETPTRWEDAGWYEPGPEPGERGPAVIAGHVDSKGGPAVFYRLRELRRGDAIRIVRGDGSVVRFRVEGLERWPKAKFPTRRVFGPTRGSTLRLITCSGDFDAATGHYVDNTIVYAARVPARR